MAADKPSQKKQMRKLAMDGAIKKTENPPPTNQRPPPPKAQATAPSKPKKEC